MLFLDLWSKYYNIIYYKILIIFYYFFSTINNHIFDCEYSSKLQVKYVAVVNDSEEHKVDSKTSIAFSLEYFIQSYMRVYARRDHPTLNGDKPDLMSIFGIFLSNFVNIKFNEVLLLHYKFHSILKLPFTNSSPKCENKELIECFNEYALDTKHSGKCTKLQKVINNCISKKEFKYEPTFSQMNLIVEAAFKNLLFKEGDSTTNSNDNTLELSSETNKKTPPKNNVSKSLTKLYIKILNLSIVRLYRLKNKRR